MLCATIRKSVQEWNIRKDSVESSVTVTSGEPMQRRSNGDVLVDGDCLAVGCKHWRIVVVVRHPHLHVRRIHMARVCVLDVDGHVEEWMQQRVKVNWLQCRNAAHVHDCFMAIIQINGKNLPINNQI